MVDAGALDTAETTQRSSVPKRNLTTSKQSRSLHCPKGWQEDVGKCQAVGSERISGVWFLTLWLGS